MPDNVRLFVNRLDVPPGFREGDDTRLPHRNMVGWGVQQLTGALADATLLLVAHVLVAERTWLDSPSERDGCFCDAPEFKAELVARGLVEAFDPCQEIPDLSERARKAIDVAITDFWPWLRACQGAARQWDAQDDLVGSVWDHVKGGAPGWRDALRAAGLSILKHNYRNQTQAVTALLTLMEWQGDDDADEEMIREAVGREVNYLAATITSAAHAKALVHDWADHEALYAVLQPPDVSPLLCVRVPGIKAADPDRVLDILGSGYVAQARDLVADALAGGSATARDIEAALLKAVPRNDRAPYTYRQVSFHGFCPEVLSRLGLPVGGRLALSAWRSAFRPGQGAAGHS